MRRNDLLFVRGVIVLATVLVLIFAIQLVMSILGEGHSRSVEVTGLTGITLDT